jgi:hypothetical protein
MRIVKTKSGYPAIWVGGGAYTNTCEGTFVLDEDKVLKSPICIATKGDLACGSQALVGLEVGDIVIKISGKTDGLNEEGYKSGRIEIEGVEIEDFDDEEAYTKPICINFSDIPESVLQGLSIYHNKNGQYFCGVK